MGKILGARHIEAKTVWFNYRRTPLGTAVRDSMAAVVDFYGCREEAEKDMQKLADRLSAKLSVVDIDSVESLIEIAKLDPDLLDVLKLSGKKSVLIASWTAADP